MTNPVLMRLEKIGVTVDSDGNPLTILHDIDLEFRRRESVAVVGPSGSGKTTLLMLCSGLQPPSTGRVMFKDKALPFDDEEAMTLWRQEHVGIVFQHFHLLPTSTALENVMLPLELAGNGNAREEAAEWLEAVGLGHRMNHLPGKLSGGEQQRVALARAMARRPSFLLADEPTGNLDQATGAKVMDILFEQAKKNGTTLVLITHDPALAARCDRSVALRDGGLHGG